MTTTPDDRPSLPLIALRDTGVLWAINKHLFHPAGYALALDVEEETPGRVTGWQMLGDGTEPWTFDSDEPQATAYAEFMGDLAAAGLPIDPTPPSGARCYGVATYLTNDEILRLAAIAAVLGET